MTVAIGALWPWARLAELAGLPSNSPPTAVILIADSRWTYSLTHREDVGTKLFQLAKDAGAVYAGDVDSGEECLSRLARRFQKNRIKRPVTGLARDLFRAVYKRHKPVHPLRIFVGACGRGSNAELWGFDSDADFNPVSLTDVHLLAFTATEEAFWSGLEYESHIIRPNKPPDPIDGAQWLGTALDEHIIRPKFDEGVGGKIQCAFFENGACNDVKMLSSDDGKSWERRSPDAGELKTFRPRLRKKK